MFGFLSARVALQNVHYSLGNLGSRPGGSPFFPKARSKLFQNVHYSIGKEELPREHPRVTCERPVRDRNLEKRDKFIELRWREKTLRKRERERDRKRRQRKKERRRRKRRDKRRDQESREETRWKRREKREDEREDQGIKRKWRDTEMKRNERKDIFFFSKKWFKTLKPARWISPNCFEKNPFRTNYSSIFSLKVQNLTVCSMILHDSNSIFRVAGINSEIFFGRTVIPKKMTQSQTNWRSRLQTTILGQFEDGQKNPIRHCCAVFSHMAIFSLITRAMDVGKTSQALVTRSVCLWIWECLVYQFVPKIDISGQCKSIPLTNVSPCPILLLWSDGRQHVGQNLDSVAQPIDSPTHFFAWPPLS